MGWYITHACRTAWPVVGGMETAIHGLARRQVAQGNRVEVISLQYAADGRGLPDVDHEGVRYRRLPRVGPKRYPFAFGLRRAVSGADLVHVHGLDGFADRLVRARDRPVVGISTHGGYLHSKRNWTLKQGMLRTVTRQTLDQAEAVWFTSEVDRVALAPTGVRGRVVANGVDLEPFLAVERLPIPGRWVVVGRIDRHKGIDRLLDALVHLKDVELIAIGPDAGSRAELEALAERLGLSGRVRFVGEVRPSELPDWFSEAELAVFPSRHEAFGIAVVEAMAAGCPVAVSDIDAHRALVEEGRTGFVIDFSQPAWAAARLAVASASKGVGLAAREAALAHGWDRRVEDWNEAYVELLGRRLLRDRSEP